MPKYPEIEITDNDLKKIIYFILMKYRSDPLHMQGNSPKNDLIGGFIERWFNKVAETVIFDNLLQKKTYKVVPDYFIYDDKTDKNAPDIIGLRTNTGEIKPFIKFNNGHWLVQKNMPRIEVKAIRKTQSLLSVREPQMDNDFFAFVETDLNDDYLTTIFNDSVFDESYLKELKMDEIFVERDDDHKLVHHAKIERAKKIGTMRLIGIYSKEEFERNTVLCPKKVKPYYFSSVEKAKFYSTWTESQELTINNDIVDGGLSEELCIRVPFSIKGAGNNVVQLFQENKSTVYIRTTNATEIDGLNVDAGDIKLIFKAFDRSSSWIENVASKYVAENYWKDSTKELIDLFDKIVST